MITNSDINSIVNLHNTFTALLHTRMNVYSTGNKQGLRKTDE